MANRAGQQLAVNQMFVLSDHIRSYLKTPHLRAQIVADEPGADLDEAAAAALEHLAEIRRLLAPFFVRKYGVGDLVDVGSYGGPRGEFEVDDEAVTVVEIRSEGSDALTVVENAAGGRYTVGALNIRRRGSG